MKKNKTVEIAELPLLSVVILNHNSTSDLKRMVRQALDLSSDVIIIDSSTDKTEIDKLKELKNWTENIFKHKFINFSESRNFGISKAKGRWIMMWDSDERFEKSKFAEMKKIILNQLTKIPDNVMGIKIQIENQVKVEENIISNFRSIVRIFRNFAEVHYSGYALEEVEESLFARAKEINKQLSIEGEDKDCIIEFKNVVLQHFGYLTEESRKQKIEIIQQQLAAEVAANPNELTIYKYAAYCYSNKIKDNSQLLDLFQRGIKECKPETSLYTQYVNFISLISYIILLELAKKEHTVGEFATAFITAWQACELSIARNAFQVLPNYIYGVLNYEMRTIVGKKIPIYDTAKFCLEQALSIKRQFNNEEIFNVSEDSIIGLLQNIEAENEKRKSDTIQP